MVHNPGAMFGTTRDLENVTDNLPVKHQLLIGGERAYWSHGSLVSENSVPVVGS